MKDVEKYTLVLNGEQAAYLSNLLDSDRELNPLADGIQTELHYSPPFFPVGSEVLRTHPGPEGAGVVFRVVGHRFVSPSNWTAWLEQADDPSNSFGVGEVYLEQVLPR